MLGNYDDTVLPKNRLESLCDGIFAIAMTLLVLDLKTPENIPPKLVDEEIPGILYNLLPSFEAYFVSFFVLAIFWLRHQIHFKYIKNTNKIIITINVVFLSLIVFVPFSVGLMMRYYKPHVPLLIYIINLLLISLTLSVQGWYITKKKEIQSEEIDEKLFRQFFILTTIPLIIFILSLITSFFSHRIAFLLIYLDPFTIFFYKLIRKKIWDK